jgi:hypothetical protein
MSVKVRATGTYYGLIGEVSEAGSLRMPCHLSGLPVVHNLASGTGEMIRDLRGELAGVIRAAGLERPGVWDFN